MQYVLRENAAIDEILFDSYKQVPARGIMASYHGMQLLGGNRRFLEEHGIDVATKSEKTVFYFAVDQQLMSFYELEDKIKEDGSELVSYLKQKKIETIMLTGDHEKSAESIAKQIGIEEYNFDFSPQDKLAYVEKLQAEDKVVVMVGDGVNDILALGAADIGIVMGSGSDIAVDVGDVVLLHNRLSSLLYSFTVSTTTFTLIKQNFAISLVYNAITIPLAMAGYVIPLIAALSMSFSSLLVVLNSLRIKYKSNRG